MSDGLRDPVVEIEDKIMNHLHERSGNQKNLSERVSFHWSGMNITGFVFRVNGVGGHVFMFAV